MDSLEGDMTEVREDQPTLEFEEGSYTLSELLESHLLPVAVQFDTSKQPFTLTDINFDLSQPLLLYKKRNIQKVSARSLCIIEDRYEEVGETLLIPEDYKGWFAVLQRLTGNAKPDDSVSYFKSVEELANSNTDKFLIGGTKKIHGLKIIGGTTERLQHEQYPLQPGDILVREKIYHGETKKKTRFFRKPKYITEKFLKCHDEAGKQILLPFEQQGIFYQVSHTSGKENRNVVQMNDIVARRILPRIIKLVYGRFPIVPCSFTGLMKADFAKLEMSVVASTIVNKKNVLLEIPVSSDIHFKIALTNDELRTNPCYRSAMSLCAERALTYMRNIKVCLDYTEEEAETTSTFTGGVTMSRISDIDASMSNQFLGHDFVNVQSEPSDNASEKDTHGIPFCRRHLSESLSNSSNISLKSGRISTFTIQSDCPTSDVQIRPARRISTGRMSFCLGNSYLTVPMYESFDKMKRDSGNNNSSSRISMSNKYKHISFSDAFFEESENVADASDNIDNDELDKHEDTTKDASLVSRTNSGFAMISPSGMPKTSEGDDAERTPPLMQSSSPPPEMPPPPVPLPSSIDTDTSPVASQMIQPKHELLKKSEYAVPKVDSRDGTVMSVTESEQTCAKTLTSSKSIRRPSTFTFADGCLQEKSMLKGPTMEPIVDTDEHFSDEHVPIYENIKNLIEIALGEKTNPMDEINISANGQCENLNETEHSDEDAQNFVTNISDSTDFESVDSDNLETKETSCEIQYSSQTNECSDTQSSLTREELTLLIAPQGQQSSSNQDSLEDNISPTEHSSATISDSHSVVDIESGHKEMRQTQCSSAPVNYSRQGSFDKPRKTYSANMSKTVFLPVEEEKLSSLSIDQVAIKLREIGIKDCTIAKLKAMGFDGAALAKVLEGEAAVQDCLQGVNLVDQQKISMFIRGWRPNMQ